LTSSFQLAITWPRQENVLLTFTSIIFFSLANVFSLVFNQLILIERENARENKIDDQLVKDSFSKMKKKKDDRAKRKGKGIRSIISLLFLFWKGIISRLLE
jgi:hypothetical protein